jgi:hypothetical protein
MYLLRGFGCGGTKMKHYNIEVGSKLKLQSMVFRVTAKNKQEAARKVRTLGFNAGKQLGATWKGSFKPTDIQEIKRRS